jgi:hypothetical protein
MSHGRQQVRDALVTALTGLVTTGTAVYSGRVYPHDTLPSLAVFTLREEVNEEDHRTRTVFLQVEARTQATADLDDAIDAICVEVEVAISADDTLGGKALCVFPPETEIELSGEAEKPIAQATMTFPAMYRVAFTDPETLIN